jgi:hypothetical protein
MKQILTEGLKHMDMEGMVEPRLGIDRFESAVGTNDDIITLDFLVKGESAAKDLAEWFERGYDWVIDGDNSPGELKHGHYAVFVEINRRTKAPDQIIEMLEDLETLTGLQIGDWKIKIKDNEIATTADAIRGAIELSPHDYRETHPDDDNSLNEWKQIAGVSMTTTVNTDSEAVRAIKRRAGII